MNLLLFSSYIYEKQGFSLIGVCPPPSFKIVAAFGGDAAHAKRNDKPPAPVRLKYYTL